MTTLNHTPAERLTFARVYAKLALAHRRAPSEATTLAAQIGERVDRQFCARFAVRHLRKVQQEVGQ